jgi:hypothetical protein
MATARMDVSSFRRQATEEGLGQHEPEPAGRGADAHAWSGSRQGTVHLHPGQGKVSGVDLSILWAGVRLTSTDAARTRRRRCSTSC